MANVGTRCLVTLDEARDYLKRTNTDDDDAIAIFADIATANVESYTKRKLKSRTYDGGANNEPKMVLNGRGSSEIALREFPVTSISAATVLYDDGVTTRSLNITGYRLLHGGRRVLLPYDSFDPGQANITITCVAGYLAGTHDADLTVLKSATLRWLQVLWQDKDMGVGRGANISVGGESLSFIGDALPKDIALALRPFERW
jgi:uncharacterized phiE125 gp8 family phage protein